MVVCNSEVMYIERKCHNSIKSALKHNPVVALLGPRQCGKSTLAKRILNAYSDHIYLDLERPSDLRKLDDAEWFLRTQKNNHMALKDVTPDRTVVVAPVPEAWPIRDNINVIPLDSITQILD
jgi:predicted AAA+ superfamily ATPase